MTYQIEAFLMTPSHLQCQSNCKPFECDFYPRDSMLVWYLLSSRVRSLRVGVLLRRLNVDFKKQRRKIA